MKRKYVQKYNTLIIYAPRLRIRYEQFDKFSSLRE
jgi:hypothetical protein